MTTQAILSSHVNQYLSSSSSHTAAATTTIGRHFHIGRKICNGRFSTIYEGVDGLNLAPVAIKFEPESSDMPRLRNEDRNYRILSGCPGIPRVHHFGQEGLHNVLVIDLLGPNLKNLFDKCGRKFSIKTVCMLAKQMITLMQSIHDKNLVYLDVRPDNFLIGAPGTRNANLIHLIDVGMAKCYRDPCSHTHIPYCEQRTIFGAARYISINAHLGREQSRRDDLESLGYIFMFFLRGGLPWQGLKATTSKQKLERIRERKELTPIHELCEGFPEKFAVYMNYVRKLNFEDSPDYDFLRDLFTNVLDSRGETHDLRFDWTLNADPSWKTKNTHPTLLEPAQSKNDAPPITFESISDSSSSSSNILAASLSSGSGTTADQPGLRLRFSQMVPVDEPIFGQFFTHFPDPPLQFPHQQHQLPSYQKPPPTQLHLDEKGEEERIGGMGKSGIWREWEWGPTRKEGEGCGVIHYEEKRQEWLNSEEGDKRWLPKILRKSKGHKRERNEVEAEGLWKEHGQDLGQKRKETNEGHPQVADVGRIREDQENIFEMEEWMKKLGLVMERKQKGKKVERDILQPAKEAHICGKEEEQKRQGEKEAKYHLEEEQTRIEGEEEEDLGFQKEKHKKKVALEASALDVTCSEHTRNSRISSWKSNRNYSSCEYPWRVLLDRYNICSLSDGVKGPLEIFGAIRDWFNLPGAIQQLYLFSPEETELLLFIIEHIITAIEPMKQESEVSSHQLSLCWSWIRKIARQTGVLPGSLFLKDVELTEKNPISCGGFADIYKGTYRGSPVAVKIIRTTATRAATQKYHSEVFREALHWKNLRHEHIVSFLGIAQDSFAPQIGLVSPWMANGCILQYLEDNPQASRETLLIHSAKGLSYLHSQTPALVHGDIKATNILVDGDGKARLTDFGLISISESQRFQTTSRKSESGSVRWMAPELIYPLNGKGSKSRTSDIYAFGMTIVEVFMGAPPFSDIFKYDCQVSLAVVQGSRPIRPNNRLLSDKLWEVTQRCWSTDPKSRPSVEKLLFDLQAKLL